MLAISCFRIFYREFRAWGIKNNMLISREPSPMYIIPANFSRSDKPINYFYTAKRYQANNDDPSSVDEVHKSRTDRALPIARYIFNLSEDLPLEPNEYYLKRRDTRMAIYPQLKEEFEVVKKVLNQKF